MASSDLVAAKPEPAAPDTLGSTTSLLVKGLVVALSPYIILALVFPDTAGKLSSIISGMSLNGMLETFGTYMLADFLSNFLQHPGQAMDYGALNGVIGREVGESFWGTRLEHIVGVAACLAVVDHFSQGFFGDILGKALSFADSPGVFIAHTFAFIFSGVAIYCLGDSAFNPSIASSDRWGNFMGEVYATYVGTNTAWFEPFVGVAVAKFLGDAAGDSWLGGTLLPATLAYATVKGVGWSDWGNSGLNDLE